MKKCHDIDTRCLCVLRMIVLSCYVAFGLAITIVTIPWGTITQLAPADDDNIVM